MEVEMISESSIKPCSSTPLDLKTYKISLLDQFVPPIFIPMILFYTNQDPNLANNDFVNKRSLLLKQTLSKTLAYFYPLAGKIKDNLSIDCNDEGVHYVGARVNISLNEYLNHQPDLTSMHKLLPKVLFQLSPPGSFVATIQETNFACGGLAIGVSVSHMFMDATSLSSFVKHWAAMASADSEMIPYPNFDPASIFPQYIPFPSALSYSAALTPFVRVGKVATRRFVFDNLAVAALKAKANSSAVENPTRVEVISAILLKCIMAVFQARSGVNKPTLTAQAVNLRKRAVPPFPECSVGNLVWSANTLVKPEETKLTSLVNLLREAIMTKTNSEFVKKIQGDGGFVKLYEEVKESGNLISNYKEVEFVSMSSWCNLGLYDINFGWGKPMWASCAGLSGGNNGTPYMNTVVLMDARPNKGIEAWVFLDEDELGILENDEELLAYASLNLSPLS